jgi:poly-gamma-glutamate synthesis protein (capsule biosynthesis protein)
MQRAQADLRILSLHSWNAATQRRLVETGEAFLRDYGGDIVFGHGPHVWRDVRIVESESGEPGVLFQSLGNFLHPELAAQRKNLIGRVLLDRESLRVRQVQAIAVAADGATASFADAPPPTRIPSNRPWTAVSDSTWRSGVSPYVRAAYFNVDPQRPPPPSTDGRDR